MDKLNLDELLRYAFSGAVALFTMLGVYPSFYRHLSDSPGLLDLSILAFAALFIGAIIYTTYRAVAYPIIIHYFYLAFYWEEYKQHGARKWWPLFVFDNQLQRDIRRWQRRKKPESVQSHLFEWGSQIHLLFTSAISFYATSFVGQFASEKTTQSFNERSYCVLWVVFTLCVLVGMYTQWRALNYDSMIALKEDPKP